MPSGLVFQTIFGSQPFCYSCMVITLSLKKNRARIRYWVWFSVSIKLLIPFSLIVNLGSMLAPDWLKSHVQIPSELSVIHTINQPLNPPDMKAISSVIGIKDKMPRLELEMPHLHQTGYKYNISIGYAVLLYCFLSCANVLYSSAGGMKAEPIDN
jgi:hypothetical protein